ncbi:poly-gamma-glutamate hydrolase family protein [Halosimplex halobium]|uniref:poly-gamma-glutamate hydrolase family protein n=1 Tax=Halosimplex halobium TaxID=3396618 RepID=UPI003F56D598
MTEAGIAESPEIAAANRCRLSRRVADDLGKAEDDHVRVECESSKAYFIVDGTHDDAAGLAVNADGLERIDAQAGQTGTVEATVPIESRDRAFVTGDIAETLWDRADADVFITCPHGGDIEYNTDEMGQYLFKKLRARGIAATAWMLHGYYTGQEKDAFKRWHVKKPVKAYDAYPGLRQLVERAFTCRYAVGFHIHKYDYVAVGGRADADLRERVGDAIRGPVPSKYDVETDYSEIALTGRSKQASMNYFAEDGQGIQIELPTRVAYNKFHSLPEAVADVLTEIL